MKSLLSTLILALALTGIAGAQESTQMDKVDWLDGAWKRLNTKAGELTYEQWELGEAGYNGIGYTMSGSDTTFVEHLRIEEKEGVLYYVAIVDHNAAPTYFKMTHLSNTGFVAENPEHDFPKKIEYKLQGKKLTAIISAGEKAFGFEFEKLPVVEMDEKLPLMDGKKSKGKS